MGIIEQIVVGNFGTWIILVCLFLILIDRRFHDKRINGLFFSFWVTICLLDIARILDYYLSTFETLNTWRYVTSILGYLLPAAAVMLIIFILLRREKNNKLRWIIFAPLFIELVLLIISPFTGLVFSFSETNNFQRGVLGFLPHVVSGIYLVFLLVMSFVYSSKFDKMELITVYIVAGLALLATVLESVFEYRFLVVSALAVSCLIYYLYFFLRQSRVDQLTGLYNRQCFYSDAEKVKKDNLILIACDLNGLKDINDSGGHFAGDEALMALSSALLKAGGKDFLSYRMGGDEFMIVGVDKNEAEAKKFIMKAKGELKKSQYMASFGYSVYKPGLNFDECLKISDVAMYLDKKNYKHR